MRRTIRYQAAIVHADHVLLLRVIDRAIKQTYWLLPGGGREAGETAAACVQREAYEETYLHVVVDRLLFILPDIPQGTYEYVHTYLCHVVSGEARPGCEPGTDTEDEAAIQEVGWFDLRAPQTWPALIHDDPFTTLHLQRLREALAYSAQA